MCTYFMIKNKEVVDHANMVFINNGHGGDNSYSNLEIHPWDNSGNTWDIHQIHLPRFTILTLS